ncbi:MULTISPECIES: calcium-binding protein [unclassified Sinorhizobium]|uniref:calcium-binding protein n=1 Tax=unclassified Sinorhizobium TaxID=2613772 RepID=UPI0024C46E9C|nr:MULTISPECIES: calcium-binding protein [unclassified Sinorhizobium]MDK1376183.1 calcium-binding protein [Sinorhizobium sp. 6-70]MDK1483034.1 calcium-binding protein [Sinorhizobium sp. 6-117]
MTAGVKIYGRGNDNTFTGGVLDEYVEGDAGNDTLHGNGGNDTLYGDTTTDNPWVVSYTAAGNDWLHGGDGNDQVNGQGGNDQLFGDAGDDDLYGGGGTDQLRGGQGSDELYGDAGDDLLDGSDGANVLWGGTGIDTFQFTSAGDESTIEDFEIGTERLQFDVSLADDFSDLTIVDDINGNAHITVGDVDITLVGVASSSNSSFIDFGLYA